MPEKTATTIGTVDAGVRTPSSPWVGREGFDFFEAVFRPDGEKLYVDIMGELYAKTKMGKKQLSKKKMT